MLSSWRDDEKNSDCCKWKGIECSNETGLVKILDLRGVSNLLYLTGNINITSLIELQNMEYLDLSYNDFTDIQITENMGSFSNLRYLNLSFMGPGGRIPSQLGNLSKLEYLDLKQNLLAGAIPSELGKLTHLRYLDLSDNQDVGGAVPSHLGNVSQLHYLDLNGNSLVGVIPSELGKLSHLQYLDLSNNYRIDGEIPSELVNLTQLQYLDLGGTSIYGAIPFQTGKLPILETLKLSGNFTLETIHAEWLSSLYSLRYLDLRSLPNLGSSRHLLHTISELIPNIKELRLTDCSLSDDVISSLFNSYLNISTSLTILDLSHNMLTSSTFQLLSNFSLYLREIYLSYNNIVLSSPVGTFLLL